MITYFPHVKLANLAAGQAEVRLFTPFSPEVAFGSSESLGWVVRGETGRWIAQTPDRVRVAAFNTRKEAVDHLAALKA
jgi:hypothetical protein